MRTVRWVPQAIAGLEEVVDYILEDFGTRAALEFQEKVSKAEMLIADNPKIMPIEPLIDDDDFEYRSVIINKRSKLLYIEHRDEIIILDFWDVRQEPRRHVYLL